MVYLTGGIADALVQDRYYTLLNAATSTKSRFGWTAGLGTEYAISPNITVNAEALYVSLNNNSSTYAPVTLPRLQITNTNKFSDSAWIGRIGVAYKF